MSVLTRKTSYITDNVSTFTSLNSSIYNEHNYLSRGKCGWGIGRLLYPPPVGPVGSPAPFSFFAVSLCESQQWIWLCTTRRKKDGSVCRASSEKESVSHEDGDVTEDSWGRDLLSAPAPLPINPTPASAPLWRRQWEADAQGLCSLSQGTGECR